MSLQGIVQALERRLKFMGKCITFIFFKHCYLDIMRTINTLHWHLQIWAIYDNIKVS